MVLIIAAAREPLHWEKANNENYTSYIIMYIKQK